MATTNPLPITEALARADLYYPAGAYGFLVLLKAYTQENYSFTSGDVSTGGDTITIPANTYAVGTQVRVTGLSDFDASTNYYVITTGTSIQLSDQPGGSAVDIMVAADGTITDVSPANWQSPQTMADLVRYEVADYQNAAVNRPAVTMGATTQGLNSDGVLAAIKDAITLSPVNADGPGALELYGWAVIKGGAAAQGDTTGGATSLWKWFDSPYSLAVNNSLSIPITVNQPVSC